MTLLSAYARPELPDDLTQLPPGWTHIVAGVDPETQVGTVAYWGRREDGSLHQWVPTEWIVCAVMDQITEDDEWTREVLHADHT